MRLHQVLTGAANLIEDFIVIAHGNVSGYPFTVYGSGFEIVILDSHFNRVQIISSLGIKNSSIVKCVACSCDGKIAVSFGKRIVLFKPVPVISAEHAKLPFHWKEITTLNFEIKVKRLCWDQQGNRLLIGNDCLHIWRKDCCTGTIENDYQESWVSVWKRQLASPVKFLEFSPDGHYFASASNGDRMIKIWYKVNFEAPIVHHHPTKTEENCTTDEKYNFIYILHPQAVHGFSWRKTSHHMPLCSVPNVLLTSCADNVCRIWLETVKYKPSHRFSHKIVTDESAEKIKSTDGALLQSISVSPSAHEDPSIEKVTIEGGRVKIHQQYHLISMYHFHLAAVINPTTDIALMSMIPPSIFGRSFQLQWLNNKEVRLATAVEAIFASLKKTESSSNLSEGEAKDADPFLLVDDIVDGIDLTTDILQGEDVDEIDVQNEGTFETSTKESNYDKFTPLSEVEQMPTTGIPTTYQGQLNNLLHEWCCSSDTLYCIHPADGSLLIWVIDYLDDFTSAYYRQVQVSFASRIPATFSKADASSLCWTTTYHITQTIQKSMSSDIDSFFVRNATKYIQTHNNLVVQNVAGEHCEHLTALQISFMVSAHADGSLNLWLITFSETGSFAGIASINHVIRSCGPRFEITQLVSHPVLPLIVGTSLRPGALNPRRKNSRAVKTGEPQQNISDIDSELILWHTSHISPLSEFKGVAEMARISSPNPLEFCSLAWIPVLYHHSLLSITNNSVELLPNTPCACFVTASNHGLQLYQIMLDAKGLISNLSQQRIFSSLPNGRTALADLIDSEQSGSDSACIMKVCTLEKSEELCNVQFLHIYDEKSFIDKNSAQRTSDSVNDLTSSYNSFYVVAICRTSGKDILYIWSLSVTFDGKFTTLGSLESPDSFGSDSASTPASPYPLVVSHCLEQTLIYFDFLKNEGLDTTLYASSASLYSSTNLNPTCPVLYNFMSIVNKGDIKFWDITLNKKIITCECIETIYVSTKCDVLEILSISCASADKFAYITREFSYPELHKYLLYVKEKESSGELVWSTDTCIQILETNQVIKESNIVQVSWMSLENGTYLIAVALNNVVYIYSQQRSKILSNSKTSKYKYEWGILKEIKGDVKDLKSESLRLTTISWSSGCFFMIGIENEIQVYSQWSDNDKVMLCQSTANEERPNSEHGVILTENCMTKACQSMKCLPQYHPDHLMALLNLGKMRRVRAILHHLVCCLAGRDAANKAAHEEELQSSKFFATHTDRRLSRTISITSDDGNICDLSEPGDEIGVIPPLMLTCLHSADKDERGKVESMKLDKNDHEDSLDISHIEVYFGVSHATLLTEHLSRKQLLDLTSQEQMHLLALSDTVASTNLDLEKDEMMKYSKEDEAAGFSGISGGGGGYAVTGAMGVNSLSSDTVDDCGLRFLLLMRHHSALLKSLPRWQRVVLIEKGMLPSEFCWAFHSDCKEELLALLPGMMKNETKWSDLKAYGGGWWIRSNDLLRRTIEKVAKTHFQISKDPLDCALFYLAMKKKSLICILYRSLRDTKMTTFFNNDFSQERWRKAALKNAYALLGKQRFEHAVAFFLLGNALWDAVQVCINRLNDLQLALVIARLYENNNDETHKKVLENYVLGYNSEPVHEDPFIRSMSYWLIKDYNEALEVLLVPTKNEDKVKKTSDDYRYPDIFNFYYYLRSHPLLRRKFYVKQKSWQNRRSTFLTETTCHNRQLKDVTKLYERKLYFQTAFTHLNAGLPSIAFEVLSMLPDYMDEEQSENEKDVIDKKVKNKQLDNTTMITTGEIILDVKERNFGKQEMLHSESINNLDVNLNRGCELSNINNDQFSWGSGTMDMATNRFSDLEEYKCELNISSSDEGNDDSDNDENNLDADDEMKKSIEIETKDVTKGKEGKNRYDIIALNLKYMCVIQCIIEQLKALPAKCTQDHTKLRSSLTLLLREELDFLHQTCDYGQDEKDSALSLLSEKDIMQKEIHDVIARNTRSETISSLASFDTSVEELSLGEKVEQVAIQSEWLRKNQPILTSLYEHCMMIGSGDIDLPAICLELLFLLHEINDHRVLTAPLTAISAGPSAPPLLLASMASFSLVASPTTFLRSMSHDLLQTVINLPVLSTPTNPVTRLADLESLMYSLSSCIYHSLCGGDDDKLLISVRSGETEIIGKQMKNGKLVRLPYGAQDVDLDVTSSPAQWPGVKFFTSILTASNKDGSHNLKLLLCEAAVAVYLSMLVSAFSRLACQTLYRLVVNNLSEDLWNITFGGGTKIVVPAPASITSHNTSGYSSVISNSTVASNPTATNLQTSSQAEKKVDPTRMKWNYKLLGRKANDAPDDGQKLFRHELYVRPQKSLCDYILQKPKVESFFDSESANLSSGDDSEEEGSVDEETNRYHDETIEDDGLIDEQVLEARKEERRKKERLKQEKYEEHLDSSSYPWLIIQLSLLKIVSSNLTSFLILAGLDISDLPTQSPLLYNASKALQRWEQLLTARLETYVVNDCLMDNRPNLDVDGVARGGMALQRMKFLLNPVNTPFCKYGKNVMPAKRLWHTLVQQESVRPIFLHYAFKSSQISGEDETDFEVISGRILHKDPEPLTSFAINRANLNYMAIATAHEIIEYDICGSLDTDLFGIDDVMFVSEAEDHKEHKGSSHETCTPTVIQRRPCSGIRRMDSHPHLPYYVVGGNDGSIRMFEFVHPDQIAQFRGAGQNERVNKMHFNSLGNKFGVVDDSGFLMMWLVANTQDSTPFLTLKCYSKGCVDFAYIGSSSLVATVGASNDHKRSVCIWDTMLPQKKALVHSFSHNVQGAHSLVYVPGQQCLIAGGKRGDICIFDVRQRRLLHTFQAHATVIKVIALDPTEMFFVSGSADGDIKVWGIAAHELFESFPKEHYRNSVSLRHPSPGVQCLLAITGGQLFSCGGDGTLKWRILKIKTNGHSH